MGRTVNLATVWGACATEKGRQFRQMSTDLSDLFPMIFCIEESVTGTAMSQATRVGRAHAIKLEFQHYGIVVQKKSTNPDGKAKQSKAAKHR
jgi:hypothetical protein